MATQEAEGARLLAMAEQIYMQFVDKSSVLTEQSIKMSTSAENLARVSFKLAKTFLDVRLELDAVKPVTGDASLDMATMQSWSKPK